MTSEFIVCTIFFGISVMVYFILLFHITSFPLTSWFLFMIHCLFWSLKRNRKNTRACSSHRCVCWGRGACPKTTLQGLRAPTQSHASEQSSSPTGRPQGTTRTRNRQKLERKKKHIQHTRERDVLHSHNYVRRTCWSQHARQYGRTWRWNLTFFPFHARAHLFPCSPSKPILHWEARREKGLWRGLIRLRSWGRSARSGGVIRRSQSSWGKPRISCLASSL